MKRSEMVKQIKNYILNQMGDINEEAHIHNSLIDSEAILALIEKAGMLPPPKNSVKYNVLKQKLEDSFTFVWEPEDE